MKSASLQTKRDIFYFSVVLALCQKSNFFIEIHQNKVRCFTIGVEKNGKNNKIIVTNRSDILLKIYFNIIKLNMMLSTKQHTYHIQK